MSLAPKGIVASIITRKFDVIKEILTQFNIPQSEMKFMAKNVKNSLFYRINHRSMFMASLEAQEAMALKASF